MIVITRFLPFVVLAISLLSCNSKQPIKGEIYLGNLSYEEFDSAKFHVYVNDDLLVEDTVVNTYISDSYWQKYTVSVPRNDFNLSVRVAWNGYDIKRDTTWAGSDSLEVFVRFNFTPFKDKYDNPEVYQRIVGDHEDFDLVGFADSLYENNIISKSPYLDDSLPTSESITFSTRYD